MNLPLPDQHRIDTHCIETVVSDKGLFAQAFWPWHVDRLGVTHSMTAAGVYLIARLMRTHPRSMLAEKQRIRMPRVHVPRVFRRSSRCSRTHRVSSKKSLA